MERNLKKCSEKRRIKASHCWVTHRTMMFPVIFPVLIKKGMWRFGVHRVLSFLRKKASHLFYFSVRLILETDGLFQKCRSLTSKQWYIPIFTFSWPKSGGTGSQKHIAHWLVLVVLGEKRKAAGVGYGCSVLTWLPCSWITMMASFSALGQECTQSSLTVPIDLDHFSLSKPWPFVSFPWDSFQRPITYF